MGAKLRIRVGRRDRSVLESIASGEKDPERARRARIILRRADGMEVKETAEATGVQRKTVWKWSRVYLDEGLAGVVA